MTLFNGGMLIVLGILFTISAFKATGIGGAFSGPYKPVSRIGRVIIILIGFTAIIGGFQMIFAALN